MATLHVAATEIIDAPLDRVWGLASDTSRSEWTVTEVVEKERQVHRDESIPFRERP